MSGARDDAARLRGVTGIVLAGGASTRMRTSKAALLIAGEPLLRRVVRRVEVALAEVVVLGPPELAVLVPGVRVLPDARPGLGPLGGLETALRTVSEQHVFVVACDMPFVSRALVRAMGAMALGDRSADAVVLRTSRGTEQLHAVYARSCLPAIERQLDAGDLALRHLLDRLRVRELSEDDAAIYDPAGLSAFNANTPQEWERALRLAERQPSRDADPLDR